ncbi:MAG: PAS domain-containing protein [Bacteroidetes bacterium]|nr:PAS domain-containing protein [Bacteroidota bacterium]
MAVIVFKRQGKSIYSFGYIMVAIATWAFFYGMELAGTTKESLILFNRIEYLSIGLLPALWIVFILKYAGKDSWLNTKTIAAFFILPVISIIVEWTTDIHHLFYTHVEVYVANGIHLLKIERGPWYVVHLVYFYIMLIWGVYFIIQKFRSVDPIYRKQNLLILIATFIPWLANVLYHAGINFQKDIDLTPFGFIVTAIVIGYGLLRFSLFDIVPVAREKVMDAMQEGVLVIDAKGRIVDANARMKDIIGNRVHKLIGTDITTIHFDDKLCEALNKRTSGKIEISLLGSSGIQYYAVTLTPLLEKDIYTGQFLLFRDVTDRHKSEERLQGLNQLKDRLFSVIAHDLRSPLNTLLGILSMVNEGHVTEQELKTVLPEISKNLGYTSTLVNNLLQWTKSQLQGQVIQPVNVDVYYQLQDIIALFENVIKEKQLKVRNSIDSSLQVFADNDMVMALLRNLLSNAIKFSRYGGEIWITATKGETHTIISIRDTGVGMHPEDLKKLFGLETFTTRGTLDEKGTGLGLLLCKEFVEKNGGTIWAESEYDVGSKFCFTLPNA